MEDAYTNLFNETIEHFEGIIKIGQTIRKFYYDDSDEEDEHTDFIQHYT